jgi:hypothetical protein
MPEHVARDRGQVRGFGHDVDVVLAVEQQSQAPPHERVVLGEHHANRALDG